MGRMGDAQRRTAISRICRSLTENQKNYPITKNGMERALRATLGSVGPYHRSSSTITYRARIFL